MEPNDLNSPPPDDAAFDAWLRSHAAQPPLPDAGFSQRVLATLPPPNKSTARTWFCLAGAAIGTGVATVPFLLVGELPPLDPALLHSLAQLSQPSVGLALGVTLLSLGYAFWPELRRRVRL